jgi:hypothetical protein
MDNHGRPSRQGRLARALTDPQFRTRVLRYCLGLPTPLETEDRRVLEEVIFRHYCSLPDVYTILFVGVDWYTRHYERFYFSDKDFWTIDKSPRRRRYGAKQHLTCALEDLIPHLPLEYFDLIVCNGVHGFGLNTREQCERAFNVCHELMREKGTLVIGWSDGPTQAECSLGEVQSLRKFIPVAMPVLGTHRYATASHTHHHVFQFYEKPPRRRRPDA